MPPTGRVNALVAEGTVAAKVVDGLRHLYTAFQKSSIYAPGHPAAVEAIRQSSEGLATTGGAGDSLLISVGHDRLMLDGDTLRDDSGALRSLAVQGFGEAEGAAPQSLRLLEALLNPQAGA